MPTEKLDITGAQNAVMNLLHAHWGVLLAEGIILVVLGLTAVILPPLATLAVAVILGWLLLISGAVGLVSSIMMRRAPGFIWSLVSALIALLAGVVLLRSPVSGAFSLTIILTVFLAFEGIISVLYAMEHRRELSGRWSAMLMSGIVDLILAALIFFGLPGSAAWAIGLLVGVNLVIGGAALIVMALHARGAAPQVPQKV